MLISATEARRKVQKIEKNILKKQMAEVSKSIIRSVKEGYTYVRVDMPLAAETIKTLEKKGFTVKKINYSLFDISWDI